MTGTTTPSARGPFPHRADALEQHLGDPLDPGNPLGFPAVLAADERADMFADGERALDAYGLGAEFVPARYGGRLTRLDELIEIMRSVYRRDPCLGLGHGVSSFIASVNIWTAGNEEQCRRMADLLLSNRKVAVAYHELAHGNDMVGTEFQALPGTDGRLLLNGRKEVVTNIQRADAVVMFARTDRRPGSRSHSQILVDKARIPEGRMRYLPRFSTVGMRGVQLGGMEFHDCPLPADVMVGPQGHGLETALKSFQVTRTTLVAMFTGILDTALRTCLRHLTSRRLYGRPAVELPEVRSVLAAAHADLLLCDAFSTVAARALHVVPAETAIYSSAVKYVVSKVLMDAMHRLSTLLGAHFYIREGEHAIFQKLLRDNQLAGFGHAARAACQMSLLPQLPLLARRSWRGAEAPPEELFRLGTDLPPVPFDRLKVSAGGRERLSSSLAAGLAAEPGLGGVHPQIEQVGGHLADDLRRLADECERLPAAELTVAASSAGYDRTHRYANVLVAAACLGLWRGNQDHQDPFLRDPAWLAAVLSRIPVRPGSPPARLPDNLERLLFDELMERYESATSLGLVRRRLADHNPRGN
ncbi:acyl-CoA dehydrogenase [Streptomyces sp. ISL-100]|uniref:acyl-CoA dehydrogenase n=1 Tax=Streptomyces sp. ISL-100 TaxID=2819173 RepID=UPI001BECDA13|nr:acyl-CoA dehydrogenase family protein [Streptomyces sp. ISL-100]MBT2398895.1 acyl-CoA dehydrogenase family protein [Streptomyces sp. ISL-100]